MPPAKKNRTPRVIIKKLNRMTLLGQIEGDLMSYMLPYVIGFIILSVGISLLLVWLIWFNRRRRRGCGSRRAGGSCGPAPCGPSC